MPLAPSAHLDVEPPLSGGSALVQPSPGVWLKLNRGEGSKKANGMAEKGILHEPTGVKAMFRRGRAHANVENMVPCP